MKPPPALLGLIAAGCVLLAGCDYEAPLTPEATRPIETRLLGDWAPAGKDAGNEPPMHVRQWDATNYAVAIEDDLFRVHHSDFAGQSFISAQDLNAAHRKYALFTWLLSDDGTQLTLRRVRTEVIPENTRPASALQRLIEQNLDQAKLLDTPLIFNRITRK